MSDTNMTRRTLLSGMVAFAAASSMPRVAEAQTRLPYRYLILKDPDHRKLHIRHLENERALRTMADAGLKTIYLEIPEDLYALRRKNVSDIRYQLLGWCEDAGVPINNATHHYTNQMAKYAKSARNIEIIASRIGARVVPVDPMSLKEQIRLSHTLSENEFVARRLALDPKIRSQMRDPGILAIGKYHAPGIRPIGNTKEIELPQFSQEAENVRRMLSSSVAGLRATPG